MDHREQVIKAKDGRKRLEKAWLKQAPRVSTYSTVSQSRMPRSITQTPREGRGYGSIPGGEFRREDDQQTTVAGGQVRMQEEVPNTLTAQRQRAMQQRLTQAERQANADVRPGKDPMSYGMPSENPPAKIPNSRGQSGSSGVYRVNVGTLTQSIPSPFEKWIEEIVSAKSLDHTGKGYRCRDCGSVVSDDHEASAHAEKGCSSGFDLVK